MTATSCDSYEIGFASEVGWQYITEGREEIPRFDYVEQLLNQRINNIMSDTGSDSFRLYITEGSTFRDSIATKQPYKGTRKDAKPWHYQNLTVYMKDVLNAEVVDTGIEADDALAIEHLMPDSETILCSRDKDLRQVPGLFYSWELGKQASFGPAKIDKVGSVSLSDDHKKLTGTGFAFFCGQVLTGDVVDNIPGLPGCGPVKAYQSLSDLEMCEDFYNVLVDEYISHYGEIDWKEELLEQGRLCWMVRRWRYDPDKDIEYPELWELGQTE